MQTARLIRLDPPAPTLEGLADHARRISRSPRQVLRARASLDTRLTRRLVGDSSARYRRRQTEGMTAMSTITSAIFPRTHTRPSSSWPPTCTKAVGAA